MTYAEYLKSQGATDEDIKLLDTPLARKGYDQMQAATAAAETRAAKAETDRVNDRKVIEKWRDEQVLPEYAKMQNELVTSKANEAKARAAVQALQSQGLIDVAKDLGYDTPPAPNAPPANTPAGFDASKYATADQIRTTLDSAGDGLAALQDIVMEHAQLFPDKPLRVRELRKSAVAAGKSVEQYWLDTYGVPAARDARATADKTAYETRLREEGRKEAAAEYSSLYGNPDARPLVPSSNPFTPNVGKGREKQPWEVGDRSNDRVQRATQAFLNESGRGASGRTN